MIQVTFTFVKRRAGPVVQFALSLAIGWVGMLVCKLIHAEKGMEYFAAIIGIIFFCLINTVISIAHESYLRYTVPSYWLYIFLVAILFLSSKFLSGISIWTLEEYRMMIFSITIFYVIVSVLVRVVRVVYEAVEKGF